MRVASVVAPAAQRSPVGPGRWRSAAVGGLTIWLIARLVLAVIAVIAATAKSRFVSDAAGAHVRDTGGTGFFAALFHWDSNYYAAIARSGYPAAAPVRRAFFPGYPILDRAVSHLLPLPVAMFVVSAVAGAVAAVVTWRLTEELAGTRAAPLATGLLMAGPYGVFLAADYAEPLYLALALAAWYAARRGLWWWAGCWCGLAGLVRVNALFLLAALVVAYVTQGRRPRRSWTWPLLGVTGVAGYFGYLAAHTGQLTAWFAAEHLGWGRTLSWPWMSGIQTAGRVLYAATPDRRFQFAMDLLFGVLLLVGAVALARSRQWGAFTLTAVTLLVMTTSFTWVSLARTALTVIPLFPLTGGWLADRKPALRLALLGVAGALFLVNATLFAFGYWTD